MWEKEPRTSYSQPPVDLDIDNWLYEAFPKADCGVCSALSRQLAEAKAQGASRRRFELAREIRNCDHKKVKKR